MNETLFYICGITLAISAVVFAFVGLKVESFPGKAMPLVIAWFAVFAVGSGTFAVLHGKDEDKAKAAEYREFFEKQEEESGKSGGESEEAEGEGAETGEEEKTPAEEGAEGSNGAGGEAEANTLALEADETELAYDKTELEAEAGKVTIDLDNPSAIPHNVAIEAEGEEIAVSETEAEGETSVTAELEPGEYTFYCSVPGHREAGMEGTLTVK